MKNGIDFCRAALLGALVMTAACGGTVEEGDELAATDGEFATDEATLDSRRNPTEMGQLLLLEAASSKLDGDSGFQRWTFEGKRGWTVRFVQKGKGFRTYLRLTAPGGRTRTKTGVRKDGAWYSEISWELPADGTYKLFATSATNYTNSSRRSRGEYTLSAEGDIFCGGIAAFQCPSHLECQIEGDFPDAGGHCVKPVGDPCAALDNRACAADPACEIYAMGCEAACDPDTGDCHPCDPMPACRTKTGGVVGDRCGGRSGVQCQEGLFCAYAPGAICGRADAFGSCAKRAEMCTQVYRPVCGCDGRTYGNACTASSAGVSVDHDGECVQHEGEACGGMMGLTCGEGLFCSYEADAICGRADATGTCARVPEICTREYRPVCGCNGSTYGNACEASRAGISVDHDGACAGADGAACGSRGMAPCGEGLYCAFEASAQCGATDIPGTCSRRAERCPQIYAPVCGCDGNTYGNACNASSAGVSIAHEGACELALGASCGGRIRGSCGEGMFCSFTERAICGWADATGTCANVPSRCTREYRPVCGCDGLTYSNTCTANAAGTSVQHQGTCR